MVKCPKCGKELDHLAYEETRTYSGSVSLEPETGITIYDTEHTDVECHFDCPHCDEELANDIAVALSILKGEEEHGDSNGPSETPHPD